MRLRRLSLASMAGCVLGLVLLGVLGVHQLQRIQALQGDMGRLLELQARIDQFNAASDSLWLLRADEGLWHAFRRDARKLQGTLQRLDVQGAAPKSAASRIDTIIAELARARGQGLDTAEFGHPTTILLNHLSMQGMALDSALDSALRARRQAIADQATRSALLFGGTTLLFGGACFAAFGLIHRRISAPVRDLLATVDGLRAGRADARTTVTGRDELGELGRALNRLARRRQAADTRLREQHEALARRERILADSQRIARIGSWRLEADSFHLEWSDETYRIVGVSPEHFTPTPEAFLEHVHPDDRQQLLDVRDPALAGELTHEATFRIRRPDGRERIVHEIAAAEHDGAGTIVALAGTIQDVTEARLAERHNERYRRLLEASQDLFCIIDGGYRYVMMTDAYARAYGFDRHATEGMDLRALLDPGFVEREVVPPLERCLAGEEQRFEADRDFPDAGRRHLLIHYFPVPGASPDERFAGVSITDITAFKRAEDELREQARLIAIAGQVARLGGFRVDLAEQRVTWSDVVAEIHGKPHGHAPTVDEGLEFYAPEHRERVRDLFTRCAQHGEPYDDELRIINASGERRWVRVVGQPVHDAEGTTIVAVEGAFQDIDASKRHEEHLHQYEALVEQAGELFAICDADYRYVLANHAYAAWHGVSRGRIEARTLPELMGRDYFEREVRSRVDDCLAGETTSFETRRTRADGAERTLLMRYFPIRSPADGSRLVAAVSTDITDLRRTEAELERQLRIAHMAGRIARVGAWTVDAATGRVEWSNVTCDIHAVPHGHRPTVQEAMDFFVDDSHERIEALVRDCLEQGEPYEADLEIVDAEGRHRWTRAIGEPVRDDGGRITGAQGAFQDITEAKRDALERERLNARLTNILESITDAFLTVDHDWIFQYVNAEAGRIMGRDPADLLGCNAWDAFPEGLGTAFDDAFTRAMERREPVSVEDYYPPFGMWLDVRVYPTDEGLALYFQDVTERHRILEQLREQEETLRESRDRLAGLLETRQSLINSLPAHIALLDTDGTIIDVNEQWRHFGRDNDYADAGTGVGLNYLEICDAATGDCAEEAAQARDGLRAILDGDREQFVLEYPCHSPERERWFRLMANHIAAPDDEVGAVVMHLDITERKVAERRLSQLAYEDTLTGLASRNGFVRTLQETIESTGWQPDAVLVMLDIDNQRDINDVYGFETGDRLLAALGERLRAELGSGAAAARIGGDEFALFLPGRGDAGERARPSDVEALFGRPFAIEGTSVEVSAHFGFTRLDGAERPIDQLLHEAEIALFHAREDRDSGHWVEYTGELDAASRHRVQVTRELRRALERHEFQLHFQPKVDLTNGHMVSGEALIRWQHPERGLVSPAYFIPVAEQSQLIGPIGDWALREACRLLAEWRAAGLDLVRVAVNVSVVQFTVGDFAATVADALDAHGVEPSALTLEITESVFEHESQRLHDQLGQLHDLGVRLSLDDFGTGYSSLLYLQRYPFDEIKIDQGFVRSMLDDDYSTRIVTTVISIARGIGADLVAEGIEEPGIAAALVAMGCRVGQGYHYSMPLAEEDFRWLLEQRTALPITGTG